MDNNTQQPTTGGSSDQPTVDQFSGTQSLDEPVTTIVQPGLSNDFVAQPSRRLPWKSLVGVALLLFVGVGGFFTWSQLRPSSDVPLQSGLFDVQGTPQQLTPDDSLIVSGQKVTIRGQLRVDESLILTPSTEPTDPTAGQIYYDEVLNQIAFYNGEEFLNLVGTTSTQAIIQNTTNVTSITNNNVTDINNSITNVTPGIDGSGTAGRIPKFTDGNTIGDSILIDNGTNLGVNGGISLTVSTAITDLRFWDDDTVPANPNFVDLGGAVELGVKFQADVSGNVNGLHFYKGTSSVGPIVGSLWTSTGTLLAQKTFDISGGSGWKSLTFDAPIPVSPGTTYVASYHTEGGGYATDPGYFGSAGVDKGPLHALVSGLDGGNGVFRYSATPAFPNQSVNSPNYWIDIDFSGAVYSPESRIRINGAQLSSSDLANDSNLAKRTSSQIFSGLNTFRPANNAADSFSIQQADTTPLFSVDTLDKFITLGSAGGDSQPVLLVVGRKIASGDPAGVDGAIYYNLAQRSFRCYRNGIWDNCAQPEVDRSFSVYEEFLGGHNTDFAANNVFGSLGWQAHAIGANGALSFDPGTPTPVAERPGVLALQTPAVANQGTTFTLGSGSGSMLIARDNIIKTAVAVGSTDQILRVGLHTQTTGSVQPVSGVWWEANPAAHANWRYCHGDGVAATCVASTEAIAANTWMRLEIRVTATGAGTSAFSAGINGTFFPVSPTTIDTTNRVSPAFSCFGTNGAAQDCYWDYFQLKGTTASPR